MKTAENRQWKNNSVVILLLLSLVVFLSGCQNNVDTATDAADTNQVEADFTDDDAKEYIAAFEAYKAILVADEEDILFLQNEHPEINLPTTPLIHLPRSISIFDFDGDDVLELLYVKDDVNPENMTSRTITDEATGLVFDNNPYISIFTYKDGEAQQLYFDYGPWHPDDYSKPGCVFTTDKGFCIVGLSPWGGYFYAEYSINSDGVHLINNLRSSGPYSSTPDNYYYSLTHYPASIDFDDTDTWLSELDEWRAASSITGEEYRNRADEIANRGKRLLLVYGDIYSAILTDNYTDTSLLSIINDSTLAMSYEDAITWLDQFSAALKRNYTVE